jgi:ketosteroid isomerase-like protein
MIAHRIRAIHRTQDEATMPDEARNVAILKDAYARWHETRGGSVAHWLDVVDHNISFGSLARGAPDEAFATNYDNREKLRAYFDGLLGGWTMIHFTVGEFVAQGDTVVMRGATAWRNKATGKEFETPKVDFWRFRDGKAVEFYKYYDTAAVLAAAVA